MTSEDSHTWILLIRTRKDFLFAKIWSGTDSSKISDNFVGSKQLFMASRLPNFGEFSGANWKSLRITGRWNIPRIFFSFIFNQKKISTFLQTIITSSFFLFLVFFCDSFSLNYREIENFLNAEKTSWDDLGSSTNDVQVKFWHGEQILRQNPDKKNESTKSRNPCVSIEWIQRAFAHFSSKIEANCDYRFRLR